MEFDLSSSSSDIEPPMNIDVELALIYTLMEEEEVSSSRKRRGLVDGRSTIHRDHLAGHQRLYNDYFSETPVYNDVQFRRRFRMRKSLFLRILDIVEAHDSYFGQRRDAVGRPGLSSLQKITAAMRMLAYGLAADSIDDYLRIAESTSIESLKRFVRAIIETFGPEYMRAPNNDDIARLLEENAARGFPGMLGSLDCMHWKWKNCPVAWKGMFEKGGMHDPTIILEAVASYDLWIWHAFFGLPGSHNDINVLDRSPLFRNLLRGTAPPVNYSVNGHSYTMGYYLTDGIYPPWATFVKTISYPRDSKESYFARAQEAVRKDVERAFGVLQSRFAIVRGPARFWDRSTLSDIMMACVIMHNMIVEDERASEYIPDLNYEILEPNVSISREYATQVSQVLQVDRDIRDRGLHIQLQRDLVQHLWTLQGDN